MRKQTLARKKRAYELHEAGKSIKAIADELNVSDRMAYRYVEEYQLFLRNIQYEVFSDTLRMMDDADTVKLFKFTYNKKLNQTLKEKELL